MADNTFLDSTIPVLTRQTGLYTFDYTDTMLGHAGVSDCHHKTQGEIRASTNRCLYNSSHPAAIFQSNIQPSSHDQSNIYTLLL
jgi:hypothetical protein